MSAPDFAIFLVAYRSNTSISGHGVCPLKNYIVKHAAQQKSLKKSDLRLDQAGLPLSI